jgi:hypothetical protein
MDKNRRTGSAAELAVAAKLVSIGYNVSIPFGETSYDLIAEKDSKSTRIQVKTATLSEHGSYRCSLTHGSKNSAKYTSACCDLLILFAPYSTGYADVPNDGFYVIPIEELRDKNKYHAVLFPSGRGKGNAKICKWEEYRDGWEKI